jgi:hypothetical protein
MHKKQCGSALRPQTKPAMKLEKPAMLGATGR